MNVSLSVDAGQVEMKEAHQMSTAFDSSDTDHMSRALLQALSQLEPAGLLNGDTEAFAKAVLARAIVEAAEKGERDETRLVAYAISRYPQTRERLRSRGLSNDSVANFIK
jgi:hypothetical protein